MISVFDGILMLMLLLLLGGGTM